MDRPPASALAPLLLASVLSIGLSIGSAHASSASDAMLPSVVMVIALESPRFEPINFGNGRSAPLALPNIRVGAGIAIDESCTIVTSRQLVENALAISVRIPSQASSPGQPTASNSFPAARGRQSQKGDLEFLSLESKAKCKPFDRSKVRHDVKEQLSLLKLGFRGYQAAFSPRASETPVVVTNAQFLRSQSEGRGYQIKETTAEGDAGSAVVDESGSLVGIIGDRIPTSDDGFVVPVATILDAIADLRIMGLNKFDESRESLELAALADHIVDSQKSIALERYVFDDKWRDGLKQLFDKSDFVKNNKPESAIIYALIWNVNIFNAIQAINRQLQAEKEAACRELENVRTKMLSLQGLAQFQNSPFVQNNLAQYRLAATAADCQQLLVKISAFINMQGTEGGIQQQQQQQPPQVQPQTQPQPQSQTQTQTQPQPQTQTQPLQQQPPQPSLKDEKPALYRFGFYFGAGAGFNDPSVLGAEDLNGRAGLHFVTGGLFRIKSVFYRRWLEFSPVAGFGTEWHYSDRRVRPYADVGFRLRFWIPYGIALTTLYSPGVLIELPEQGDNRVSFSYSVIRNQVSAIFKWFTLGVVWAVDLRTATADSRTVPGIRPYSLTGIIGFLY